MSARRKKPRQRSRSRRAEGDEFNRHMKAVLDAMRKGFGTAGPSFEEAKQELRRRLRQRGDSTRLRDVVCFLNEDCRTAMLAANWSSDEPVCAHFLLPVSTTEDTFDGAAYVRLCES